MVEGEEDEDSSSWESLDEEDVDICHKISLNSLVSCS